MYEEKELEKKIEKEEEIQRKEQLYTLTVESQEQDKIDSKPLSSKKVDLSRLILTKKEDGEGEGNVSQ